MCFVTYLYTMLLHVCVIYRQLEMLGGRPYASTKMARITGTWPMIGQFSGLMNASPLTLLHCSSAAIYKEVPPRVDKKLGALMPGSCEMAAVRVVLSLLPLDVTNFCRFAIPSRK